MEPATFLWGFLAGWLLAGALSVAVYRYWPDPEAVAKDYAALSLMTSAGLNLSEHALQRVSEGNETSSIGVGNTGSHAPEHGAQNGQEGAGS